MRQRRMERQHNGGVVTYIGRRRCWVPPPPPLSPTSPCDWQSGMLDCLFALRYIPPPCNQPLSYTD